MAPGSRKKLPCSLTIQYSNQSSASRVVWQLVCISSLSFAYYFWGALTAILLSSVVLIPWASAELGLSKQRKTEVLLGWSKYQVHLYIENRVAASISLESIVSIQCRTGAIGFDDILSIPSPCHCELMINTPCAVHIRRFGPLPVPVIRRIRQFASALERKRAGYYESVSAPKLDGVF